jgi:hypothetical protein
MTRTLAVTTCNAKQWELYGRRMVRSFLTYWSDEVALVLYAEGFAGDADSAFGGEDGGVRFIDLDEAAPWLAPWKAAYGPYWYPKLAATDGDFRYDAIRFSHKIAAIGAAAERRDADVLIWLDADTVTHAPVTAEWLESLFPEPATVAWLDRPGVYCESGFLMFRMPAARGVIEQIVECYCSGMVFRLAQQHDAYVIQQVVDAAVRNGDIRVHSLSGPNALRSHPWLHSPLAERMDHLKGARKLFGRTPKHERRVKDDVAYWR